MNLREWAHTFVVGFAGDLDAAHKKALEDHIVEKFYEFAREERADELEAVAAMLKASAARKRSGR